MREGGQLSRAASPAFLLPASTALSRPEKFLHATKEPLERQDKNVNTHVVIHVFAARSPGLSCGFED
jgi:hypothetical protein